MSECVHFFIFSLWFGRLNPVQTPVQRDHVLAKQADQHFDAGRYIQAAQCYAQSSRSFEEVVLRFIDANERDALRCYLISRLERTRKTVR